MAAALNTTIKWWRKKKKIEIFQLSYYITRIVLTRGLKRILFVQIAINDKTIHIHYCTMMDFRLFRSLNEPNGLEYSKRTVDEAWIKWYAKILQRKTPVIHQRPRLENHAFNSLVVAMHVLKNSVQKCVRSISTIHTAVAVIIIFAVVADVVLVHIVCVHFLTLKSIWTVFLFLCRVYTPVNIFLFISFAPI